MFENDHARSFICYAPIASTASAKKPLVPTNYASKELR
jgi:hypothetical protein